MEKIVINLINKKDGKEYICEADNLMPTPEEVTKEICEWVKTNVELGTTYGCFFNQLDYTDVQYQISKKPVLVNIDYNTPAVYVSSLIKICVHQGVILTINYIKDNKILEQVIF